MRADVRFLDSDKAFWAHVRSLSEKIGYTDSATKAIKAASLDEIVAAMASLNLNHDHLVADGAPTPYGEKLVSYFAHRASVLNGEALANLMNIDQAKSMYEHEAGKQAYDFAPTMNKQKGDKKQVAYLTTMTNMLIAQAAGDVSFDRDPQRLTTVTKDGMPLRTLARRVDGAFPSTLNPIAVWEIKEYYHTTSFGSRVAGGVYETLLDGLELEEMSENAGVDVEHILIIDARDTWWKDGKSYLCRMIDMLHMKSVDEILFGREITKLPALVQRWREKLEARQAEATVVLDDDTPVL
jgi:hypothetical protein